MVGGGGPLQRGRHALALGGAPTETAGGERAGRNASGRSAATEQRRECGAYPERSGGGLTDGGAPAREGARVAVAEGDVRTQRQSKEEASVRRVACALKGRRISFVVTQGAP